MNHPRRIEATPDDGEDARVRGMVGIMEARIAQKASQPRLAEPVAGPKPSAWAPGAPARPAITYGHGPRSRP
ncbi:MAG: hypothetical protein E2O90_00305 [Alphaproteobacteria bacterium]|nr:hypothetical protein [Pseudomonadota bacterium]TDI68421.1 MAG: hypothetical protein E2O90_00305 [Alphaproteobacteria bacterium]